MNINYNFNSSARILIALILFIGSIRTSVAQLSGNYTINNSIATGGSNYATWADFKTAISANGVIGAVTVDVLSDLTESQVQFAAITGASSTNTITINGNGKYLASSTADAVILLNGADYFTFDGLIVRNTLNSTNAQGVRFLNGADYNTIKNCTIEFSSLTVTSTSGGAYISFSTSATSRTTTSATNHGSYNLIDNNLMRTTNTNSPGPTFGIAIQGSSSAYTSTEQNNTISNNVIQNFYNYAIRNYNSNGNQIINNDISRANSALNNCNSTLYGIYSYNSYAASRPTIIEENSLHDWPYSGSSVSNAPSTLYAFYTSYNYGNSTYRFSVSGNSIKDIYATTNLYLGYNFYNYFFDLIDNIADNADVSVSTSSSYNFHGWYNGYTYSSYRFNGNTIQNCDGGYYWYGIRNYYPNSPSGVQEINYNTIQNNKKSYYYTYRIYSYYAQYASSTYPVDIIGNIIRNNSSDYYYTYNIYTYYYGAYNITDNTIADNITNYYYMYNIYNYYYGTYNVQRNKITNNKNTTIGYNYGIYNYNNYNINITDNLVCNNNGYYTTYGVYAYSTQSGSYKANVRQNTIKIDGTNSSYTSHYSYGLYCYLYYHTAVNVEGNIVDINGNYGAYPAYTNNSVPSNIQWDRNSYFINNITNQYWYSPSGSVSNFASWSSMGFAGTGEKFGDPKWNDASVCDLRSNALMNQNNLPFNALNSRDANGVSRNTAKNDRGALEGFLDIQNIRSDFAPNADECSGFTVSPRLTLKNNFLDDISGFDMAMSVNGELTSTKTVTSVIAVSDTGFVTFNPIKFSKPGMQFVKIFLLDADDDPSNDTLTYSFNIKVAPGGGDIQHDTIKSAAKAFFDITGMQDITTNGEAIVYHVTPPSRVGYTNTDHLFNGGTKWFGTVTGVTKYGVPVPGTQLTYTNPAGTTDAYVTFNPSTAFVDSTITISIKITDLFSGCDTIYFRKVLVAPQGIPDFKLPTIICDKDEVFFENISTVTSGSLLSFWDFGDGSPIVDATNPVYRFNGPGTYSVKLTVVTAPFGYVTTISKTINVNEIPNANFKNVNACEGVAVKLINTTTIGSGSLSYVWDFGDGSPTTVATNTSRLYSSPGGYKVTLHAAGNGCVNTISKNVYQFARPVASFGKLAGSCQNDLFEFKNNSSISLGEFSNNWNFDDAGNIATMPEPVYKFSTSGVKNVKLMAISEFGCIDSMIIPIVVKTIPTTSFSYPFACSRTATQFINTSDLNGEILDNWEWDFGDGGNSSATAPIHSWFTIGKTTVKLKTNLANGCSSEVSQMLNVGVQPLVDFEFSDQCTGEEVPFTNLTSFTSGTISYEWNFGDNTTSILGSPRHYFPGGSVGTQTFTVMLKAQVIGGCKDSAYKTININPLPVTCDFDITRDYQTSLTAYKFTPKGGAMTGVKYVWLTGDGSTLNSNASSATYSYDAVGNYCITMIAKNAAGCECSKTKCETLSTGLKDASAINKFITIFPNPTSGVFNVKLDAFGTGRTITVNIYNSVGGLIKSIPADTKNVPVDLSAYSGGVYLVKVITEDAIMTQQIILNK